MVLLGVEVGFSVRTRNGFPTWKTFPARNRKAGWGWRLHRDNTEGISPPIAELPFWSVSRSLTAHRAMTDTNYTHKRLVLPPEPGPDRYRQLIVARIGEPQCDPPLYIQ
jgi:hypothetical protein